MTNVIQKQINSPGTTRDRPITHELANLLQRAGAAAGIDEIVVYSGGQPGTSGKSVGGTRHNGGRAADLYLRANGKILSFTDGDAPQRVRRFITACTSYGAVGVGAGVRYMGPQNLHIGFGINESDTSPAFWGEDRTKATAPHWLQNAAEAGWAQPNHNWPLVWGKSKESFEVRQDDVPTRTSLEDLLSSILNRRFEGWRPKRSSNRKQDVELPNRFSREVVGLAIASHSKWGVPASITLAQWALESNYGRRMPKGSNNPFGIKAGKNQPAVSAMTHEEAGGSTYKTGARFRAYSSLAEAFDDHGRLLAQGKPYASVRHLLKNPDKYVDAMGRIYATDSSYAKKLKMIMLDNNLYRFDTQADDYTEGFTDTENKPEPSDTSGWTAMIGLGDQGPMVSALQQQLTELGYPLGKIDGKFGPLTAEALYAFKGENGLPINDRVDTWTLLALKSARPRVLSAERLSADESALSRDGSRIVRNAENSRILSWIAMLLGGLGVGNSAIVNSAGGSPTGPAAAVTTLQADLAGLLERASRLTVNSNQADTTAIVDLARRLSPQIITQPRAPGTQMSTIFDILPTFFANDTVLQTIMKGVAAVASGTLPGFVGSTGLVALGFAARLFANRIAGARVDDHRTAVTRAPLI